MSSSTSSTTETAFTARNRASFGSMSVLGDMDVMVTGLMSAFTMRTHDSDANLLGVFLHPYARVGETLPRERVGRVGAAC